MKQALILAGIAMLASAGPAVAQPGHGKHGNKGHHGHVLGQQPFAPGINGCPPGLAKKSPRCMPPGQAKKLFNIGQRVPLGYNGLMGYNALPYDVRNHYGPQIDPYSRYIYRDNYLYRVDPRTMLVQQILGGLLR